MEEIKNILKSRRTELGLTMLDIAKAVGVSEATVSRWESGDIADMKRSRIAALAKILKISPNVIMGWKEEDSFKSYGSLLDTDDEDIIELVQSIIKSSEEDIKLVKKIIDLSSEQKSKLKIIIESNII